MSAFGDAVKAIREVLLMQSRMDQLELRLSGMSDDLDGLTDLSGALRDRVARLEGIIEGVGMAGAAASRARPRLPKA